MCVCVCVCVCMCVGVCVNCTETHTKCSRCPLPRLFQTYIQIPSLFFSFKNCLH